MGISFKTPVICTRPSNFIGRGISPSLLPGYLIKSFKETEDIIKVKLSSSGDRRDYVDIRDACEAILNLSLSKNAIGEIFNISQGKSISNIELLKIFEQKSRKKAKVELLNKDDFFDIFLSNDKIKEFINWEPKYTIEQSIEWCLNNFTN